MAQGVSICQKKGGETYYRASITYKRKHISLGSYALFSHASMAYEEADFLLHNTEIGLHTYESGFPTPAVSATPGKDASPKHILPFEKWVILLNFRDNGVYFHTPIYLRPNFFYYYYSPELILKFDIDDLFYYASHKIMKRGNHYFVADFGMQVNILNRYGIMNYAVPGRDYHFDNGDVLDFRRENLIIVNQYHGVSYSEKRGKYRARIHINGNYKIGYYDTMDEAAIAYNKAVDILRDKGCQKNYSTNYLENISADAYNQIYKRLPISKKIYAITFPYNQ